MKSKRTRQFRTLFEALSAAVQQDTNNDYFPQEVRQLLYGKGRQTYRILFTIKSDAVSILHIRHAARQHLGPES